MERDLLEALIESSTDIITVLDGEGGVIYSSPAASRVLGRDESERSGGNAFASVHPDDMAAAATDYMELVASEEGATRTSEFRFLHADGTWRVMEAVGTNRLRHPSVRGIVINSRDVTDRVEAEQALRASEERYRRLVELSPEVILVHREGRFSYVNPAGVRLFGASSEEELLGRPVMDVVPPSERAAIEARIAAVTAGEKVQLREERLVRLDGEVVDVEVLGVPIEFGGRPAVMMLARDITDRRRAERALAHQALHDHLTGLANRTLLLDRLAQAIARRSRQGHRVAVLLLDLDRFKRVNDTLGHEAGDHVLQAVAARVTGVLRASDTLARLGGDEFVVVCEELEGPAEANRVADRIIEALAVPMTSIDDDLVVGVSIGIAVAEDGDIPDGLLRDADAAMYRAKEQGRGRSELFDAGMRDRVLGRLQQERALQRALRHGELRVHFQPVVSLPSRGVVGAEALVRWEDPARGLVLPAEFITLAEETGLIVELGEWVLAESCREATTWGPIGFGAGAAAGAEAEPFELAVNLSTRQLSQPDLSKHVGQLLARHGLERAGVSLCLEITESFLLEDPLTTASVLGDLKALGVKLAIDDFGMGYSSLAHLQRFSVDRLKVDRSFVAGLGREEDSRAIVSAIVELGHALGLLVVAEGVEDELQASILVELGCDRAQGYLFARPGPPDDVDALLAPAVLRAVG